jgi:hypothetical protein
VAVLAGVAFVAGLAWKLVDWAYKLHVEALKERLELAKDRLLDANAELEKLRLQFHTTGSFETERKLAPERLSKADREASTAIKAIDRIIEANSAAVTVTQMPGSGRMQMRHGRGYVIQEEPKEK